MPNGHGTQGPGENNGAGKGIGEWAQGGDRLITVRRSPGGHAGMPDTGRSDQEPMVNNRRAPGNIDATSMLFVLVSPDYTREFSIPCHVIRTPGPAVGGPIDDRRVAARRPSVSGSAPHRRRADPAAAASPASLATRAGVTYGISSGCVHRGSGSTIIPVDPTHGSARTQFVPACMVRLARNAPLCAIRPRRRRR
jgi:hypothetical protein